MTVQPTQSSYPSDPIVNAGELPDPFRMPDGGRVTTPEQWSGCAQAWREMIFEMEYGGLPPEPEAVEIEALCHSSVRRWPESPRLLSYRIHCHGGARPFAFCAQILLPSSPGRRPAIITGDGCWWPPSEVVIRRVMDSSCALLIFNRTELAEDLGYPDTPDKHKRSGGLYDVYPGRTFGALSAWAWGYHRCVDLLLREAWIDPNRIAVTGLSRGGKTALVAGATDERIALVNDTASCAAGSAVFRYVGAGGETLNIINAFPSWFGSGLRPYLGREQDIPFDQHCLLATISPRPLLLTFALDDRWSNPEGMVQSAWAAGEVYRFLGAPDDIAFHLRNGGHGQTQEDWHVLLDFIGWHWGGQKPTATYNRHPYRHLRPAFSWKAPSS